MRSSIYQPLADYLASKKGDVWDASFGQVEEKLGRALPRSAYRHQAWWANQSGPGHSQTHGWRSAGWRTAKLDLERQRVRFEREEKAKTKRAGNPQAAAASAAREIDEDLVRKAIEFSGIDDRIAVINAALREFIRQEAKLAVIAMGGSQPDFKAAPRERPWA